MSIIKTRVHLLILFLAIGIYSCAPATAMSTSTSIPNSPIPSTLTKTPIPTATLTSLPTFTSTPSDCQLSIRGTYNYSKSNSVFNLQPGRFLFYDKKGGGHYSNDQAGCELNADCTQVRAINKDSNDPSSVGVLGPWVDVETGTSSAQWQSYIVQCSLAK